MTHCQHAENNTRIEIECPVCNDAGCDACDNEGHFEVGCPQAYVVDIADQFALAGMTATNGCWPVAGGVLDQAASFVSCVRLMQSEENAIQEEKLRNGATRR